MRLQPTLILTLLVACLISTTASFAIFVPPSSAPVDRLVENAEAYLEENPQDAHGHYVLGRIHYLAWSIGTGQVPHFDRGRDSDKPRVADDHALSMHQSQVIREEARRRQREQGREDDRHALRELIAEVRRELEAGEWSPPQLTQEQRDHHADRAIAGFRKALRLDPDNGLYHLGLASLADEYAARAAERGLRLDVDEPAEDEQHLRRQWQHAALLHYHAAYRHAAEEDADRRHRPPQGIQFLVSYEAVQGYQRLAEKLDRQEQDADRLAEMDRHIQALEALPRGPITPIVFSFQPHDSLDDLIDHDAAVAFDLDGTGREQRWNWPHADTAILVWDPHETGRITSGRQLFGSVTWWLMPRDGYHALDLLDDNRDGKLTGDELAGLAVWFDRSGDGIAREGEVIPLRQLPITAISVEAVSRDGDAPMNPRGIRLENGDYLPTYDWLAQPRDGAARSNASSATAGSR